MLAALDILNRLLGYFNIQDKPKGQAFTIVALIANFYLLYIGIQNVRYPDFRWRGIFFLAVFFVLLYFIVLNVFITSPTRRCPLTSRLRLKKPWAVTRQPRRPQSRHWLLKHKTVLPQGCLLMTKFYRPRLPVIPPSKPISTN